MGPVLMDSNGFSNEEAKNAIIGLAFDLQISCTMLCYIRIYIPIEYVYSFIIFPSFVINKNQYLV